MRWALSNRMLVGVSRLEAAVAEDKGAPSDTNALTLAAALDQLALVCAHCSITCSITSL